MLVAKNGTVIFEKAYGYYTYDSADAVETSSVYDLASLTKMLATTLAIMKLTEEGKVLLDAPISLYLPTLKKTNKANLTIRELLLHQSGLAPGIPFEKEIYDRSGLLSENYRTRSVWHFTKQVADGLFVSDQFVESIWARIQASSLRSKSYAYSDLGFLYLGRIVQKVSGKTLDKYVDENFYIPLQLAYTGFHPLNFISRDKIVPSEYDLQFRKQILRGTVQDPTAAWMGGVAGNAGLFSNAHEVFMLMQMLLNGGSMKGHQFLSPETIGSFTQRYSTSRRGLGFDMTDPQNAKRDEPYPTPPASLRTYGHTGYTGTCAWADPESGLVFVFVSNRLYPNNNNVFSRLNIRSKLHEAAYHLASFF